MGNLMVMKLNSDGSERKFKVKHCKRKVPISTYSSTQEVLEVRFKETPVKLEPGERETEVFNCVIAHKELSKTLAMFPGDFIMKLIGGWWSEQLTAHKHKQALKRGVPSDD